MNFVAMIDFWARLKPDTPAILMLDSMITYASLSRAIRSTAGHLSQLKLDPSVPVGILVDHPARSLVLTGALTSIGIPSIVVRDAQVAHLSRIGAKTLLHDGRAQDTPGISTVPIDPGWFGDPAAPVPAVLGRHERTKLVFTSGTTGIPKAIAFSDEDIATRSSLVRLLSGDAPWLRALVMPGLSTIFGFAQAVVGFESGRTVCFASSPEDAARAIELFSIELLVCSTQQAQNLVAHLQTRKQRLRSLKYVWIGGAPLTPQLGATVGEFLCRDVFCIYASTEAHLVAFGRWEQIKHAPGAVGFVCPWAQVECVNPEGVPLPPGREGDIRIKTSHQGREYSEQADTAERIGTWFYPGDRGSIGSDGLLVIKGRTGDTINRGGLKVSAVAMEQCIAGLPGIIDAAVCSISDRTGAEQIVALTVSKSPVSAAALSEAVARAGIEASVDKMAAVEKIPRNELGKINRDEIRTLARRLLG